jgi:hypothetical protein
MTDIMERRGGIEGTCYGVVKGGGLSSLVIIASLAGRRITIMICRQSEAEEGVLFEGA